MCNGVYKRHILILLINPQVCTRYANGLKHIRLSLKQTNFHISQLKKVPTNKIADEYQTRNHDGCVAAPVVQVIRQDKVDKSLSCVQNRERQSNTPELVVWSGRKYRSCAVGSMSLFLSLLVCHISVFSLVKQIKVK